MRYALLSLLVVAVACTDYPPPALPPCALAGECLDGGPASDAVTAPIPDTDAPLDMASLPGPDMAPPGPDMTPPGPDMAPPGPDMAPPGPDMAPPGPDMAPPGPDMAPPEPDMEPPEPDMAPIPDAAPPTLAEQCLEPAGNPLGPDRRAACGAYVQSNCWVTLAWSDVPDLLGGDGNVQFIPDIDEFIRRFARDDPDARWPVESWGDGVFDECDARRPGETMAEGLQRLGRRPAYDAAESYSMCVGTRGDGQYRTIRFRGTFDWSDVLGIAFACAGGVDPTERALNREIEGLCSVHLARADNYCGAALEGRPEWTRRPHQVDEGGPCDDIGNYPVTSTAVRGGFAVLPTAERGARSQPDPPFGPVTWTLRRSPEREDGPVDGESSILGRDDSLGIAWKCSGATPFDLAKVLQEEVHVSLAWVMNLRDDGLDDVRDIDDPEAWPWEFGCRQGIDDHGFNRRCASSSHDGLFHRFSLPFDVYSPANAEWDGQCVQRRGLSPDHCWHVRYDGGNSPHIFGLGIALQGRSAPFGDPLPR